MENEQKCSSKQHDKIDANVYCIECKVFMCNKCENFHLNLLNNHHVYKVDKNIYLQYFAKKIIILGN